MSAAATPTTTEAPVSMGALATLDERDAEPRTPMKRLGSTRKLAAFNNIRMQLAEQSRVLEWRAEAAAGVAGELGEYCRRRADLEHEYARALDKLARAALARHKDHKHKREQWTLTGAFSCWQAALDNTRALSRDHAALAELYAGPLAARLQRAADDAIRLHRKCKDIVTERHEELGAALAEAGGAAKAHAAAAADWRAAAAKLRAARDQRDKLAATDPTRHKKLKALDKELEKRRARHSAARARALRARADYVLSLEAANATLQRYYLDDIAEIMLCMEVGFEAVVGRTVRTAAGAEGARGAAAAGAAGALLAAADALDALADRQRVVCAHATAFAPPRPLPYRGPQPPDQDAEMRELIDGACEESDEACAAVTSELAQRLQQLEAGARQLRAECRESAKTLDAAEAELVRQMEGAEIDVGLLFGPGAQPLPRDPAPDDDGPRRDQEDYYLSKFRSYVSCAGRLARLESKAAAVRARLLPGGAGGGPGGTEPPAPRSPATPPRRAALRRGLFAAPLADKLPTVLTSCVRVIATYGLRHQGIFRVSGSQVEMQALRGAFERGEDPLARVRDASDINSVCGLLKLYLRELRPPLVPSAVAERLLRVAAGAGAGGAAGGEADDAILLAKLREALASLPTPNMLVLRYLAAFLAHLTEYSEQNMMDAWNLAICLGPTLLAARGEGGAQVAQQNLVNELLKRIIVHHTDLFPQNVAPHALYSRHPEPVPDLEDDSADGTDGAEGEGRAGGTRGDHGDGDGEGDGEGEDYDADIRDDLSLFADDDDDLSSEGDSGEWREREANGHRRAGSLERGPLQARAQPAELNMATPAAAAAAAGGAGADTSDHSGPVSAPCSIVGRRLAEATPDLVLDLPLRAPPALTPPTPPAPPARDGSRITTPPADAHATHATPHDSADTFAHNRDTLKKRPHRHTSSNASAESSASAQGEGGSGEEAAGAGGGAGDAVTDPNHAGGSPVPARNTARVAAKFADLTLTGGSLKPALAAKPALLRRPTPHPVHVRSQSQESTPTFASAPVPASAHAPASALAPAQPSQPPDSSTC